MNIGRLGIFATESTIKSGVYETEIHKYNNNLSIYSQSCPKWVYMVENHSQFSKENREIIKSDLDRMLKNNPDKIVLGCTHYPYLLDILSEDVSSDLFIDPSEFLVKYIIEDLKKSDLLNLQAKKGLEEFYVSSNPDKFKEASEMFYKVNKVNLYNLDEHV